MEKTEEEHNKVKEAPQSRARYDRLRFMEKKVQDVWAQNPEEFADVNAPQDYQNLTMAEKNKQKYMVTFPYPYMNGFLHLGHAFSMSKAEFSNRYQRQRGKHSLFPFGFHCTGMPIQAAANRLAGEIDSGKIHSEKPKAPEPKPQEEQKKTEGKKDKKGKKEAEPEVEKPKPTQYEILQQLNIPEEEIVQFKDAQHWLHYFPPKGMADLKEFGVSSDWRRSFITTSTNPYYDSFINWQFKTLKELGKVFYGKKYTIYSEKDGQPCADHDRSVGEGVGSQEYVGIKIKLLEMPACLQQFAGKKIYLIAATLRPETMYGQTNCYVLPEAEYGVFAMKNDEFYIMSARAARNFAFQELTVEYGKYPSLAKVTGQELIGKALKAPLSVYEKVYALPMKTISMEKGTGIVTSVPSDSPDDWAALRDLQTKAAIREEYGVDEEWCVPFAPVPIINIPDFGDMCAVKLVEDLKIKSQKDKDLLQKAKDSAYKMGFYQGRMIVGIGEGLSVEEAKPKCKKLLMDEGLAVPYYEPEKEVVSRSDDKCIVASCYQWFLAYGEEQWKEFVRSHLLSDEFEAYNTKTLQEFTLIIDWLKEWGCTRTQGLGTLLPWDQQFKIESLSDSTIYMAYYTICHQLQGDLEGTKPGALGIPAEDLDHSCWDYVFKKGPYVDGCKVPEEKLAQMRHEFEYWYPMDMRVSAKDLIRNHLTMCLYNHAAIWEDKGMMPRSIFCNGYMVLNKQKMSKSTGNFLTIRDCIEKFGVDATRLTLADSGDSLDDANFDTEFANSCILKLFTFEEWIKKNIQENVPMNFDFTEAKQNQDLWDNILENAVNQAVTNSTQYYEEMKFKQSMQAAFFIPQGIKEDYLIAKNKKSNPYNLMRFIEAQLTMMNPIIPHFAQFCWEEYVYPVLSTSKGFGPVNKNIAKQIWPTASKEFDKKVDEQLNYMKDVKSTIRLGYDAAKSGGGGKKKKGKGAAPEEQKTITKAYIFVATEYPEMQKKCMTILNEFEFNENNEPVGDHVKVIREAFTDKKQAGLAMKFVAFRLNMAKNMGKEAAFRLEPAFDETALVSGNQTFLFENLNTITEVHVLNNASEEAQAVAGSENARENALPSGPTVYLC